MRFWSRSKNRDLDEEIQAHLNMAIGDRMARGESPEAARLAALREFGNTALVKEVTRATWGGTALAQTAQDFRLAARMLRKNPGFTAVVALTLALGVGANSAIFSVARSALAPPPIPQFDRVVLAWTESVENKLHQAPASVPDYRQWQESGIFAALGAFMDNGYNVRLGDRSERVDGVTADAGFFQAIGIPAEIGRVFSQADTQAGATRAVVLSDSFWRSHFAADRNAIGKSLTLDGVPHTIIGVVPPAYAILGKEQVYDPLIFEPAVANDYGSRFFGVLGRIRAGLSLPAAQREIRMVEDRLAKQIPEDRTNAVVLQPIEEASLEDSRALVTVLICAVGFVLLIACANIANLLMARGTARTREMTVRAALGASRWQLTRQLLCESLLLALAGGALAIVPATFGTRFILSFELDALPDASQVVFDWWVLAFHFALALATGLVFGLLPAWQACETQVGDALKASSRFHTGGAHQRLRSLFVVSEVALTVVLMAGAGLMVRSFLSLRSVHPGYNSRGVLTANVEVGEGRASSDKSVIAFFDQVLAKTRVLPGVTSAAAVSELPSSSDRWHTYLHFSDRPDPQSGAVPTVIRTPVTTDFFRTLKIPLLSGRAFRDSDTTEAPAVAIVDERAARLYWPNKSPIGQRVWIDQKKPGGEIPWREIVGVAGAVSVPGALDPRLNTMGQVYLPEAQYPASSMALVVRTAGDPSMLAEPLRQIVRSVDIDQPLFHVQTMEEALAAGRATQKLGAWVLGTFGLMALLLSMIGVYGVTAFSVGRRWHEFGIRMSLGARPMDVLQLVTRQVSLLNTAGIAIGLAGAWGLTRLMSSMLFGVGANDPLTFLAVAALLSAVTMLAAYVPARQATKVDPAEALREE